ncbi:MAG: NRDE family protein [Desulfopila sp.]|jgi:uncharacterized protein with NRDE domain|nr:NRDE family protein [Desulfopila sp.]
MCIILFSYKATPGYRLVLAANRDEFLARPTAPLSRWGNNGEIFAGRDLQAGGTWLGITTKGRFGALTNYREGPTGRASLKSRGELLVHFLEGEQDCAAFLDDLVPKAAQYNGFNLLLGDTESMYYYSNRGGAPSSLKPGIHGLSNHLLNSSWPKVERGKLLFKRVLLQKSFSQEELFAVLADTCEPDPDRLPQTGVGPEWERLLSPIFIKSANYGTRSSAILTISEQGHTVLRERTYPQGAGECLVDIEKRY